ncbi:MAG TPA: helix-turn-helix transcriptional regulator [Solirubrobacterales bacterium]
MSLPPTTAPQLGAAIRTFRTSRKLTIEDLAGEADVHYTHVSSIERGKSNPGWEIVSKLAAALEVSVGDLERVGAEQAEAES